MEKEETWETVQIKTFINWINSKLEKGEEAQKKEEGPSQFVFSKVSNLKTDLQDGLVLHALLYSLNGSVLRHNKKPVLVVHKRENIHKIIEYLKEDGKVEMVNVGAEDIQQGSIKLTLGLIWRFILAFSLPEVRKSGEDVKDKLLRWCQKKIERYGVTVNNFGSSWLSGTALSALVHSDVGGFVFNDGSSEQIAARAIALASEYLHVAPLICANDLVTGVCDEKSLLTYLMEYYSASVENNGKIKRKLAEQAAIHAEQGIIQTKEQISKIFDMLNKGLPDLEIKKKELDARYTKIKILEESAVRATVMHIIQINILQRMKAPYTPSVIELPAEFRHLPVIGVYDAVSFADTLKGWSLVEGSMRTESTDEQEFVDIFTDLMGMSQFVTFSGAYEFLMAISIQIEEMLMKKQKSQGNSSLALGHAPSCSLSFSSLESRRVFSQRLAWCLSEIKDGIKRFADAFMENIKQEKALANHGIVPAEEELLSFPSPPEAELSLIGGQDIYLRIISGTQSLLGISEFNPIAPEAEK